MCTERFRFYRCVAVRILLIASVVLMLCRSASAQEQPFFRPQVLQFSPSAAANGMGSGFVAASFGASAIHYNPAALTRTGQVALEGNVIDLYPQLAELRYYHPAGAFRTGLANGLWLGAAYTRVDLGTQFTGSPGGYEEIKNYEWVLSFAAATQLGQSASLGLGLKYVRSVTGFGGFATVQGEASAFAIDLGFLHDGILPGAHFSRQFLDKPLPWSKWVHSGLRPGFSLGVALANIGPQIEYADGALKLPLPQTLRIGLAWNLFGSDIVGLVATGEFGKFLVKFNDNGEADGALKAIFTAWGDESLHDEFSEAIYRGGFEVRLLQLAAFRFGRHWDGGIGYGYNTFGFSLGPPGLQFSFAEFSKSGTSSTPGRRTYTFSINLDKLL